VGLRQGILTDTGRGTDDLVRIAARGEESVARPVLGADRASWLDSRPHGTLQTGSRGVGNLFQADAADSPSVQLRRDHDQCLARGSATAFPSPRRGASRPLPRSPTGDPAPAALGRVAAYPATSRPYGNCPSPGRVGAPTHALRTSGWSQTPSRETTAATASWHPGRSCPRSRRSERRSGDSEAARGSLTPSGRLHTADSGSPQATATERGTHDKRRPSRTAPRNPAASSVSPP